MPRPRPRTDGHPLVVYWNNQPTPYLVARLNAVVDRGEIDLEVWFDELRQADRSWNVRPDQWKFAWRLLQPSSVGPLPIAELVETRPDLFICNYDRLNMIIGAMAARVSARRVAVRALPPFAAQAPITLRKRAAWNFLFRMIDGAKVPGRDGRMFSESCGLPGERSHVVRQSIDVDLFGSAEKHPAPDGAGKRFVVVSRMIRSKGIDELLEAWRRARPALAGSTLELAGDGSDEQRLRAASADLREVRWLGFRQPEELPSVYSAADVLIFPTLGDPNGLVVEEAMAAGLPILSTDAAGDVRTRVPEGEAGWVVEAGDVPAMARALERIAGMPQDQLAAIGQRNRRRAQGFRPETYAQDFAAFVHEVSETPSRSGWASRVAYFLGRVIVWTYMRRRG